ncbi:MAG: hypothetical protein Kow0075_15310 [Salibacteraceae bacterium]
MKTLKIADNLEIKSDWNTFKGKLKQEFGELTDDDLMYLEGKQDEVLGYLQKKLNMKKEEALDKLKSLAEKIDLEDKK